MNLWSIIIQSIITILTGVIGVLLWRVVTAAFASNATQLKAHRLMIYVLALNMALSWRTTAPVWAWAILCLTIMGWLGYCVFRLSRLILQAR